MSSPVGASRCGRQRHLRRVDVLCFYLDRALSETELTLEDFALALAQQYHDLVPEHARSLELELPDMSGSYQAYSRVIGRLRKRVQRYVDGAVNLPDELEEAWAYALPGLYGERCRHELVWRYGFTGAMSMQADPCPDAEVMGRLLSEVGRATTALSRALADGQIDPDDIANGEIETDLRELEAAVGSIRARVQVVRDELDSPIGADRFAERRQIVRAARSAPDA